MNDDGIVSSGESDDSALNDDGIVSSGENEDDSQSDEDIKDIEESVDDTPLEDGDIDDIINKNLDDTFDKITSSKTDDEKDQKDSDDEINFEEFIEDFNNDENDDDLDKDSDTYLGDGEEDENTFASDKDGSEDVQFDSEGIKEEIQEEFEEEVDEDSDSLKVKFGSKLSEGGILSSIKSKFSLFNDDSSEDDDSNQISDEIKDKLEEDDFIYVDHSEDEIIEENDLIDESESLDEDMESDIKEDTKSGLGIEDDLIDESESLDEDMESDIKEDTKSGLGIEEDDLIDENDSLEYDSEPDVESSSKDFIKDDAVDIIDDEPLEEDIIEPEPINEEVKQKPKINFKKSTDSFDFDDEEIIKEDNAGLNDGSDIESIDDSKNDETEIKNDEDIDVTPVVEDNADLGSDEDYIYVDHNDGEGSTIGKNNVDVDNEINNNPGDDSTHEEVEVASDDEDMVDLGSDDDYIYVDHSNDEESIIDYSDDENEPPVVEVNPLKNILFGDRKPKNPNGLNESKISDAIRGTSKLNLTKEEVKTVHGEIIDEDIGDYKPAPKDDDVVEVEIISGDFKNVNRNNLFENEINEDISHKNDVEKVVFKKNIGGVSDMERNRNIGENDFNRIIDEAFDNHPDGSLADEDISNLASALVSKAFDDVISDAFNKKDDENTQEYFDDYENNQSEINNYDTNVENAQKDIPSATPDGVTYYKGVDDVTSPLRKNNLYYDGDKNKNKSVKDSIKSGIRDIKYIRKSLNEIENPTKVGYVSVVDRTEEYDENDYVTPENEDYGEEYIPQDEGLTFAEKEELRYERELKMEKLKEELSSDDNTIVTVHEEKRREDKKDQALEDIIQIADEDYKEIEKERFRSNNTLKDFDDNKLPKRGKIEDEIVDYKFASDFGLNSQKDLFEQPIGNVSKSINEIVNTEGPIHVDEVVKRVKDSCNIKRAGSKMKKQVLNAIKESENSGSILRIGDFLYDASSNDVVIRKRVKPNIDLISDEEIAKNIETILSHKQNVTTASLTKEVSRNFGFRSTSRKTSARIKSVLDSMIADSTVKLDKDFVELN